MFLLGSCVLLASAALAQTDTQLVIDGYSRLRTFPAIDVQVNGTERIGNQTITLGSDIRWAWNSVGPTPVSKLHAREYRNGYEVKQTIGDGTTLFSLNELRNEYITHNYGFQTGQQAAEYRLDLLQHFNSFSTLPGAYGARLIREIYGSDSAVFRAWVDGAAVTILQEGSPARTDPITGRTYTPSPTVQYIMYEANSDAARSVVFERQNRDLPDGTTGWVISHVYIALQNSAANQNHVLDVTLTPSPMGSAPSDQEFAIDPPVGSRSIESSGYRG